MVDAGLVAVPEHGPENVDCHVGGFFQNAVELPSLSWAPWHVNLVLRFPIDPHRFFELGMSCFVKCCLGWLFRRPRFCAGRLLFFCFCICFCFCFCIMCTPVNIWSTVSTFVHFVHCSVLTLLLGFISLTLLLISDSSILSVIYDPPTAVNWFDPPALSNLGSAVGVGG